MNNETNDLYFSEWEPTGEYCNGNEKGKETYWSF